MKNKLLGTFVHLISFFVVMAVVSIVLGITLIDQKTTNPVLIYSPFFFLAESLFKTVSLVQQIGVLNNILYVVLAYLIYYPASYIFAVVVDSMFSKYFFTKLGVFPTIKIFMKKIPYNKEVKNTKKINSKIITSEIDDVTITDLMSIFGNIMGEDGYISLQNKLSELSFVLVSHHIYHNNQDGVYRVYKKESKTIFDVERGGKSPLYFTQDSLVDISVCNSSTADGVKKFMFIDFKYSQNFEVNNDVILFGEFFSDVIKSDLKMNQDFNEEDRGNRYQIKIPIL